MNVDLLKKNVVVIPVVIAILSGTVASIRYVLNLTNTINDSKQEIITLHEKLDAANESIKIAHQDISNINGVIQMSKEKKQQLSGPKHETYQLSEEQLALLQDNNDWSSPEQKEAIKMLILGCRKGQENGIFELEEARTLMDAIDLVQPKE